MANEFTFTIDVSDAEAKLNAFIDDFDPLARAIGDALAQEYILPRFRNYPMQTHNRQPFVSDRQRRKVMALVREGKVPYQRTMGLAALWEVTNPSLRTTLVRSTRQNAKYVIGEQGEQSRYHAGNWPTVDQVAKDVEDQAAVAVAAPLIDTALWQHGLQ